MSTNPVTVTTKVDKAVEFEEAIAEIMKMQVLVGIPSYNRRREEDQELTNVDLLALHTIGSPLQHIPARPVIEPAIEAPDNQEKIERGLSKAGRLVLNDKTDQAYKQLKTVAMLGQNIARGWFTDPRNNWAPNSYLTAKRKAAKISKKRQAFLKEMGIPLTRPLIDTGQLRKSIIGIVRDTE
jgi:hypothetical protein